MFEKILTKSKNDGTILLRDSVCRRYSRDGLGAVYAWNFSCEQKGCIWIFF